MRLVLLTILTVSVFCSFGQVQVKSLQAVRVTHAPRIDGSLDDPEWENAPVATDFITNTPVFGNPAFARTEVKVLYDQTSIYIGAHLYDNPDSILKQFTARDQVERTNADYFAVFLDSYHDRQNAYQFQVTTRNVQTDARVSPQAETSFGVYGDLSWDAVWESQVSFTGDGWEVEIRIPYFSIRFARKDIQDWGIQFLRFTRRRNESSFWNPVDPNINGLVNQFGDLKEVSHIIPPLRLSFSPYVSGGYRNTPTVADGNRTEWLRSGGMDVKYGISESFTLDATLIPDFGQVVSDNVVNNITPYEVQFRENRPFFTEGTELFNKSGTFYSRRIGATPGRFDEINNEVNGGSLSDYSIIKNPGVTRLYNAIKFSGRTRQNLGIGIFNAVTQPAKARLHNLVTGTDTSIVSEPLTNYNILVLDQALPNRSYVTFTNTNVIRNGMERDANVSAVDLALYNRANRYGIQMSARYSKIFDSTGGYDGFATRLQAGKVSGRIQYYVAHSIISDQYDPNDLGYLAYPNEMSAEAGISYNVFQSTPHFLNQRYSLSARQSWLYKPNEYQNTTIEASAFWVFHNFWDLTISTELQPFWFNDFFELQTPQNIRETPRTRLKKARNYFFGINGSSDSRKKLYVSWSGGFAESPNPNDPYYYVEIGARFRFSDRLSVDIDVRRQHDNGYFGFSFLRDPSTQAPILARREYTEVIPVISGTYNFTSRMNLTFRARHYWNKIINTNFYDVKPDGYWTERFDFDPSDYNSNYNAFNLDVFFTWDFRLGSRIVLGWKNWLGTDYEFYINGNEFPHYLQNAKRAFATPHGNEITLRFIYFLNYRQLFPGKS